MKLSLSVRVAEAPGTKEVALMSLEELARLAADAGYNGVCMRASQAGVQTPREERLSMRATLDGLGLAVTMITGDFDIAWNNEGTTAALADISPYLDVAEDFGATLIRIGMKSEDDIALVQRACDVARERGIRLAHQSHTQTLFEKVDESVDVLKRVDRENFGIIYEPANLHVCGEEYGPATIEKFAPWLMNVYLQNFRVTSDGPLTIGTWVHGVVNIQSLPFGTPDSIDFPLVFEELAKVGYDGNVTVHHNVAEDMAPAEGIGWYYRYLSSVASFEPRSA